MRQAKSAAIKIARGLDNRLARLSSRYLEAPPGVLVFLFHSIIPAKLWSEEMPINYRYALSDDNLFQMVDYFQEREYKFVSAEDLRRPLEKDGKYLCITFDDGYANNIDAIERLWKIGISSSLFLTTHNADSGEGFWWDCLYRYRSKTNDIESILAEEQMINQLNHQQIRDYFSSALGISNFNSIGELDRPITPKEAKFLKESSDLSIANHTHLHQNLTCLTSDELENEINTSQKHLENWGLGPLRQVAYPGGIFNHSVLEHLKKESFDLGYTDRYIRNVLDSMGSILYPLQIGRYIISCRRDVIQQCQLADAKYSLLKSYSKMKNPLD